MPACTFCGKDTRSKCCYTRAMSVNAKCSQCGTIMGVDGSWRWNGEEWEHKCQNVHPQAGHFKQESVDAES